MNIKTKRKFLALAIGILATVLVLVLAELGARIYLQYRDSKPKLARYWYKPSEIRERERKIGEFGILPPTPLQFVEERIELVNRRPIWGHKYSSEQKEQLEISPLFTIPIGKVRAKATFKDEIIFDVNYNIDKFGRRVTPGEEQKKSAERFFMLVGDSQVFGEGIGDDETLSYFLGKQNSSVRVYNYGLSALMPGQTLDWMRKINGETEISEKRGTILYFWADYHILRNIPTLSRMGSLWFRPFYFEREDGEIVAEKTVQEVWPIWTLIAKIYSESALLNAFGVDWPKKPRPKDYEFAAKLISQIKREGIRLGADQFYVVFYPLNAIEYWQEFIPYLEKASIHYIDYGDLPLWNMVQGLPVIPFDGHSTAEANEVFAREISRLRFLFEDAPQ